MKDMLHLLSSRLGTRDKVSSKSKTHLSSFKLNRPSHSFQFNRSTGPLRSYPTDGLTDLLPDTLVEVLSQSFFRGGNRSNKVQEKFPDKLISSIT